MAKIETITDFRAPRPAEAPGSPARATPLRDIRRERGRVALPAAILALALGGASRKPDLGEDD